MAESCLCCSASNLNIFHLSLICLFIYCDTVQPLFCPVFTVPEDQPAAVILLCLDSCIRANDPSTFFHSCIWVLLWPIYCMRAHTHTPGICGHGHFCSYLALAAFHLNSTVCFGKHTGIESLPSGHLIKFHLPHCIFTLATLHVPDMSECPHSCSHHCFIVVCLLAKDSAVSICL